MNIYEYVMLGSLRLYCLPNENSYLNILGKLNQNAFWCRAIHFLQYHLFLTWCSNIIHIIIVLCNMQLAPNCAFKSYSRMDSISFHFRTCSKNTLKVNGGGCSPKSNRPLCFSKYGLIPCILIGSSIDKHTEWPLPKKWFCWEKSWKIHKMKW